MKALIFPFCCIILMTSCLSDNYKGKKILSPSGKYMIQATVNHTDELSNNYRNVVVNLFDNKSNKLDFVETNSHDFIVWTLGWSEHGDTIVLQNSDTGNKAWVISNKQLREVNMNSSLHRRAEYLKSKKYNY